MQLKSAKGIFTILAFCSIVAGFLNISNYYHPPEINTHGIPQGLIPGIFYLILGLGYILLIAIYQNRKSKKP
jgi:hypothetical protein